MNERKIIIGIVIFTLLIFIGGIFLFGKTSAKPDLTKTAGAKIEALETAYDFQTIQLSGGLVSHNFKVRNVGTEELRLANFATSCMCTKVSFKTASGEGPQFGMKGMSKTIDWMGKLQPGEEGEIVAVFDPAFHGPQGVGPIDRLVSFETNDPDKPYIEFSFKGTVGNEKN